jgi:hypothetical protein
MSQLVQKREILQVVATVPTLTLPWLGLEPNRLNWCCLNPKKSINDSPEQQGRRNALLMSNLLESFSLGPANEEIRSD